MADEAYYTALFFGNKVERLYDVGVAGIHRLLNNREIIEKARVIVAVAGMEGALPSVVGGLVDVPVIAVPTSVGYGANFDGLAPLLAMLNSCASGISVVNIDNEDKGKGTILIVTGGTSDIPVADEAYYTALFFGNKVERLYDVGVAGIHRLLNNREIIERARVIVAVAGMEGALPSVVGGLVDVPVIAVPTSVGYGANFDGLAPLLAMLNSCASGISVVNIDNGFGAGYLASTINKLK